MTSFQTQPTDQTIRALIIGARNQLSELVEERFLEEQVEALFINLDQPHALNRCREALEKYSFFRIVIIAGFNNLYLDKIKQLLPHLEHTKAFQLYLLGVSTSVDSSGFLTHEWRQGSSRQEYLLDLVFKHPARKKVLIGQDVFVSGEQLIAPLKFMFQADKNGVWLDPSQPLHLQNIVDFFQNLSKELISPDERCYLIRGRSIKTNEFLTELSKIYQSFYNYEKLVEKINTKKTNCLKPALNAGHNIVKATVESNWREIAEELCRDLPSLNLSLDPRLMAEIKQRSGILTSLLASGVSLSDLAERKRSGLSQDLVPKEIIALEPDFLKKTNSVLQSPFGSDDFKKSANNYILSNSPPSSASPQTTKSRRLKTTEPGTTKTAGSTKTTSAANNTNNTHTTFVEKKENKENKASDPTAAKTPQAAPDKTNKQDPQTPTSSKKPNKTDEDLDLKINKLFSSERAEQKTQRRTEAAGILKIIGKKTRRKQVVFWLGIAAASIGCVVFMGLLYLNLAGRRFEQAIALNLESFEKHAFSEIKAAGTLVAFPLELGFLPSLEVVDKMQELNSLNQRLLSLSKLIEKSSQLGEKITAHSLGIELDPNLLFQLGISDSPEIIGSKDGVESLMELIELKTNVDQQIHQEASVFQLETEPRSLPLLSEELRTKFQRVNKELDTIKRRASINQILNPHLADLLGAKEERVYFLVIQDERELRPTGGYLQALAMITFRDGLLSDSQVYNSNYIDRKLMGRLDPQPEVKLLLGEDRLFLREANWDPDFSRSAKTVNWFIQEAFNQRVDGIFGINYGVLEQLLHAIGDVDVDGYEEVVGAKNLHDRLRYYADEEGEQAVDDNFQIKLWESSLNQLKQTSLAQQRGIIQALFNSFDKSQAIVNFYDPDLIQAARQLGWSGEIIQPECPPEFGENCHVDQLFQVEANIGVNKVNPYVSRQTSHHIEIKESSIIHRRQLELSNRSHSQIWPLGNYRAYFRFYTDTSADLRFVKINGQNLTSDSIIERIDHEHRVFGVVAEAPINSSVRLGIEYSIPISLEPGDSYFYFNQAQPGISEQPLIITLSYPSNLSAGLVVPYVEYDQNQLLTSNNKGHTFIAIRFRKPPELE